MSDTLQPFTSSGELVRAIQHPDYSHPIFGEAYVKNVQARLAISDPSLLGTTQRTYGGATSTVDPMVGRARIEFPAGSAELAREVAEGEQEFARLEIHRDALRDKQLEAVRIQINPVPEGKKAEPFAYQADLIRAVADPRYERDEEYRAAVQARVVATDGLGVGVTIRSGAPAQRETAQ